MAASSNTKVGQDILANTAELEDCLQKNMSASTKKTIERLAEVRDWAENSLPQAAPWEIPTLKRLREDLQTIIDGLTYRFDPRQGTAPKYPKNWRETSAVLP